MQDLLDGLPLTQSDKLFRPFGGGGRIGPHLFNAEAVSRLLDQRYTVVLWNSVPRDWLDPTGWPERAHEQIAAQQWSVMVLHDLPTGAMDHLPGFLDDVMAAGVEIVQDFPDDCVPIRAGAAQRDLRPLTAA
jgi:hypothetical protein